MSSLILQLCAIVLVKELGSLDDNRWEISGDSAREEAGRRDGRRSGRCQSESSHDAGRILLVLKYGSLFVVSLHA